MYLCMRTCIYVCLSVCIYAYMNVCIVRASLTNVSIPYMYLLKASFNLWCSIYKRTTVRPPEVKLLICLWSVDAAMIHTRMWKYKTRHTDKDSLPKSLSGLIFLLLAWLYGLVLVSHRLMSRLLDTGDLEVANSLLFICRDEQRVYVSRPNSVNTCGAIALQYSWRPQTHACGAGLYLASSTEILWRSMTRRRRKERKRQKRKIRRRKGEEERGKSRSWRSL